MKNLIHILLLSIVTASCGAGNSDVSGDNDSTVVVIRLCQEARRAIDAEDADSAFSLLLQAEPYTEGCVNKDVMIGYYDLLAQLYEKKNLFNLQEQNLIEKQSLIVSTDSMFEKAYVKYELGVSRYAQSHFEDAVTSLREAIRHSPPDSLDFIARCYVMLSQVYLQTSKMDSVKLSLEMARQTSPSITEDPLYRLSEVYLLYGQGDKAEAASKLNMHISSSGIYEKMEFLTLLATIHEEQGNLSQTVKDLRQIIACCDSAAIKEAADNTARIHKLRHEEQIQSEKKEQERLRAVSRARTMTLVGLLSIAIAIGVTLSVSLNRRAVRARQSELEALRLAEDARVGEEEMRTLNQDLQKRYYDHLYAIILPILNAQRTKTGFIDLNEKSWKLIEENTDMVLPHFTRTLRKNHPSLGDEDIRFCCLVAMQVPNPVIANVYGIAPSSVSVRKQRMKKKLDEGIVNETLENYLAKYSI